MAKHIKIYLLIGLGLLNFIKSAQAAQPYKLQSSKAFLAQEWRIAIGAGYAFYAGNQREYTNIVWGYGQITELQPNFTLEVFKQINDYFEVGGRYTLGHMQGVNLRNNLGYECEFNEVSANLQYSINENIALNNGPFTFNVQAGLGLIHFQSQFFEVSPVTKQITTVYSAVGYGDLYKNSVAVTRQEPDRVLAPIGNIGLNIGFRLGSQIHLYWNNNLSVSTTNKMSGNLFKKSKIPPDGYLYTGLALSIRLGAGAARYGCPKF